MLMVNLLPLVVDIKSHSATPTTLSHALFLSLETGVLALLLLQSNPNTVFIV